MYLQFDAIFVVEKARAKTMGITLLVLYAHNDYACIIRVLYAHNDYAHGRVCMYALARACKCSRGDTIKCLNFTSSVVLCILCAVMIVWKL